MAEALFPGVECWPPLAAVRGDRGNAMEALLWSGVRALVSGDSMD